MIRFEEKELETAMQSGSLMVAVPFEITKTENTLDILVFSEFETLARRFLEQFRETPFSDEAYLFVRNHLSASMNDYGYRLDRGSKEIFYWYSKKQVDQHPLFHAKLITDTKQKNLPTQLTFSVEAQADDITTHVAVVMEEGSVVSCAQVNDISEDQNVLELNVETAVKYRGRGYGTEVVVCLSNELINQGFQVTYCARAKNEYSNRIAQKAGFAFDKQVRSFVFYNKQVY